MTDSSNTDHSFAPRAFILLPFAVALHIAEEWFGGFTDWARLTLDLDIPAAQFLSTNLTGLVLFAIGDFRNHRGKRHGLLEILRCRA